MRDLLRGAVAGAAGTFALNATTYLDMALRGRPSSGMPAKAAGQLAEQVGVHLGEGDPADNRREGIGALLGLATGLGWGAVYGLVRSRVDLPLVPAALALAVAAMVGSDAPMVAEGLTDPRTWGVSGWVSDAVPHLAYGFVVAAAYEVTSAR